MDVKICPRCNEHNLVTARVCKNCDLELISVAITKVPADEASNNIGKRTFASGFLLGFIGWFISISLILEFIFVIIEKMGPSGIILVPITFFPILVTLIAIFLAFRESAIRARRMSQRNKGVQFGILTAYVINFVMNLILNMDSDPLAIVGSILGWPFYMGWLGNLF